MDLPPVPCRSRRVVSVGVDMGDHGNDEDDERKTVGAYIATGEITALEHEIGNDAVELVELGVGVAKALLAGAEGTEVLDCLGDDVVVELKVDAAGASWRVLEGFGRISRMSTIIDAVESTWHQGIGLTLRRLVLGNHLSRGIRLVLGTGPRHIKVGLDDHVGGRSVEGSTEGWHVLLLAEKRADEEGGGGGGGSRAKLEHACNQSSRK